MDDEALAPVIGVSLIVAIMVALSVATVLILKELQPQGEVQRVHFAGSVDEAKDEWELVRGPGDRIEQSDIQWRGDPGARYAINGVAGVASPAVPTQWMALGGDVPFEGGSIISFCGDGVPALDWQFHFRIAESGTLLSSYQHRELAPCI